MKAPFRKIILLFICFISFSVSAQIVKESKGEGSSKGAVSGRIQRKAAKQKWKEQRSVERQQKKEIRDHDKRLQTKKTRKRMRETKKKSDKMKSNKRDFFLVRWFKRIY